MTIFSDVVHGWQNFYFMVGGTAATLIGLMFVAVSLGQHLIIEEIKAEFYVFVGPSLFYFVSALLLACVMLVPQYTPIGLAFLIGLGGIMGLIRTVPSSMLLTRVALKHQDFNLGDWLAQIIGPVASYILIALASFGLIIDQWPPAFMSLWLASILLLLCAISNTWSLVLWIVEHRKE